MTHIVTGLITKQSRLNPIANAWRLSAPIYLTQGFDLLPLKEEDLGRVFGPPTESSIAVHFERLSKEPIESLMDASTETLIMYFETEYWGGDGGQGAALFHEGRVIYMQWDDIGPINRALALLGVKVTAPAIDEFESLGLHRRRTTEEWLVGR